MKCALVCIWLSSREQPIDEHTIRYVIEQEPSTLDPAKSTTSPEATVQLQLFDGLVRLNDESEPEAALAKSWDISDDGREYTFHLRPDLKWSNGEPLTAHDFEYAWKRVLDPEVHADNAYMLYVLKMAKPLIMVMPKLKTLVLRPSMMIHWWLP